MQETCLQIADHCFTIAGSFIVVVLTGIMIYLMIRDSKKKIAIDELKEQTKELKGLSVKLSEQTGTLEGLYNEATKPRIVPIKSDADISPGEKPYYKLIVVKNDIFSLETHFDNDYYEVYFKDIIKRDFLAENTIIEMFIIEKTEKRGEQTVFITYNNNGINYKQDITILPNLKLIFRPPRPFKESSDL